MFKENQLPIVVDEANLSMSSQDGLMLQAASSMNGEYHDFVGLDAHEMKFIAHCINSHGPLCQSLLKVINLYEDDMPNETQVSCLIEAKELLMEVMSINKN
ncbi:hypothetical protein NB475_16390 [Vibrio alginolyticus]|uniref:hypothetical protein n=1 Tax=Vibrio alginolyticus TaxID=663 RepID=UPI00215C68D5|nr:hypothetical protein [Vibrio alginolyticus]MCR9590926.1 hypothetical protein [Vibrio alginolyticus]